MDRSDTRRGRPSAHRRFAAEHRAAGHGGSPDDFGVAVAILLGDLCLAWCDEMLLTSGLPDVAALRAKRVLDVMRTELIAGQYLDLLGQARGDASVEQVGRVTRFKSAKYTVERPLHLGAALAGAPPELFASYSRFGLPLGEAFQLRDDVLGVFGDPSRTGKPAGDDLREGKRTLLVVTALERASARQTTVLRRGLGSCALTDEDVDRLREVIEATGARDHVERRIDRLTDDAAAALRGAPVDTEVRAALTGLALASVARES